MKERALYRAGVVRLGSVIVALCMVSAATWGVPRDAGDHQSENPAPFCAAVDVADELVSGALAALTDEGFAATFTSVPGRLDQLVAEVAGLADDGLDPGLYPLDGLRQLALQLAAGSGLFPCQADGIAAVYLTALRDLRFGRVDPVRESLVWYERPPATGDRVRQLVALARLGSEQGPAAAFAAARPAMPSYRDLRLGLQRAREAYPGSWSPVAPGKLLRRGDSDPRVVQLRARLAQGGYLVAGDGQPAAYFSGAVEDAVLAFQRLHGIKDDGVVGPHTLRELNMQPARRLAQIRANLERLRWFAGDLEPDMLLVDIAGAVVTLLQRDQIVYVARVQAGQPARKTPVLKSRVTHVTVNPTWTVPPTILRNDVLPAVRRDIGYLAERHIRVLDRSGAELDPRHIDWHNPGALVLRQDAGPHSALGQVAIRFPNPFAVYLHDTPSRHLFDTSGRFYSSGCVRVENALDLVKLLFWNGPGETIEQFHGLLESGRTANVRLAAPMPLLMFYWTAVANRGGVVSFRPDVYGRDARLLGLLDRKPGSAPG